MLPFSALLDGLQPDPDHGEGAHRVDGPESWAQGRALFGGALTGFALRALAQVLPADRPPRSVLTSFVGPVAPGPLTVVARSLREGRSLSQGEARILQNGELLAVVLVAAAADRPSHIAVSPDAAPPRDTGSWLEVGYVEGVMPAFTQAFDYRWDPATAPFSGSSTAEMRGLVRLKKGGPVGVPELLALLDAWPAPILPLARRPIPASTVTWMVDLITPPPPGGFAGDAFWRFEGQTTAAAAGYADVTGSLFAEDGRLVAVSRQLVAEFSARG